MKITFIQAVLILTFAILLVSVTASYGQKEFVSLASATDSSCGYTLQNPLRLKNGNEQKSMRYSYSFFKGLRTQNNQTLTLLSIATADNPNYADPKIKFKNRYTGKPLGGNSRFLDKYLFLTSNSKDSITLYVDVYSKGDLQLPVGLTYVQVDK